MSRDSPIPRACQLNPGRYGVRMEPDVFSAIMLIIDNPQSIGEKLIGLAEAVWVAESTNNEILSLDGVDPEYDGIKETLKEASCCFLDNKEPLPRWSQNLLEAHVRQVTFLTDLKKQTSSSKRD